MSLLFLLNDLTPYPKIRPLPSKSNTLSSKAIFKSNSLLITPNFKVSKAIDRRRKETGFDTIQNLSFLFPNLLYINKLQNQHFQHITPSLLEKKCTFSKTPIKADFKFDTPCSPVLRLRNFVRRL